MTNKQEALAPAPREVRAAGWLGAGGLAREPAAWLRLATAAELSRVRFLRLEMRLPLSWRLREALPAWKALFSHAGFPSVDAGAAGWPTVGEMAFRTARFSAGSQESRPGVWTTHRCHPLETLDAWRGASSCCRRVGRCVGLRPHCSDALRVTDTGHPGKLTAAPPVLTGGAICLTPGGIINPFPRRYKIPVHVPIR